MSFVLGALVVLVLAGLWFTKNIDDCNYGINFIDFSDIYNVKHYATSPNLLASFIKIEEYKEFESESQTENKNWIGSSHFFFVMKGNCDFMIDNESNNLSSGDIIIVPFFNTLKIKMNYE